MVDWHDYATRKKRTPVEKYSKYQSLPRDDKEKDFDDNVKKKCKISTDIQGMLVQSEGERLIVNYLYFHKIDFIYDTLIKGIGGQARPDFRIKKKKIIIEYWGMKKGRANNPTYDEKAEKKLELYRLWDYKLIEVFNEHLPFLNHYLAEQLNEAFTFSDEYGSEEELRAGYEPDDEDF